MNSQKRKLMIALNEAFEGGETTGRFLQNVCTFETPNTYGELRVHPDHARIRRQYIERLVDWWDQVLSDEEDLL